MSEIFKNTETHRPDTSVILVCAGNASRMNGINTRIRTDHPGNSAKFTDFQIKRNHRRRCNPAGKRHAGTPAYLKIHGLYCSS